MIISRYCFLRDALSVEDEFSLDYLLGAHPGKYEGVVGKISLKGYVFRTLRLLFKYFKQTGFSSPPQRGVLFYAGTLNQLKTILPVTEALDDIDHTIWIRKGLMGAAAPSAIPYLIHPVDYLAAAIFSVTHGMRLYLRSAGERRRLLRIAADRFFQCYFDLLVARRMFSSSQCRILVLANDHNPDCRSMLLVARMLGIEAIYMQHAAVSDRFPPLEMKYAFLDGIDALEAYERSYSRSANGALGKEVRVFLNGQKKNTDILPQAYIDSNFRVGISLNRLDNLDDVRRLLHLLHKLNVSVLIRPHPGDPRKSDIRDIVSTFPCGQYSDSREQGVEQFLSMINLQIAADSSVHLEAMLAGVPSYYHSFGGDIEGDYYGFIRSGMIRAFPLKDISSRAINIESLVGKFSLTQQAAVRRYSETYGTIWQGKEGALAAETVREILSAATSSIYIESECSAVYKVFRLADKSIHSGGSR